MRFWLICQLLVNCAAFAQSSADATAAISGVVKGVDIPAIVYLQAPDDNPTRYYDGYQATTKEDGSFSFRDVKPGTYQLRVEASGFMSSTLDTDGAKITLRAHEIRKGVGVSMVRKRTLCGQVTENGSPRPAPTWVGAFRYDPEFDSFVKTFLPRTEVDGTYRFVDLDPGTYYLQGYNTWYPGSSSFREAKPVTVGPDPMPAKCTLDIPLQNGGCNSVRKVSGQIAPSSTNESTQYRINVMERSPNGGRLTAPFAMSLDRLYKAGDTFSGVVCPGNYDFVLSGEQGSYNWFEPRSSKVIFDSIPVSVGQTEVTGLVLTPRPMASITGEVRFEDITRRASCPGLGGQHVDILRKGDGQFQSANLDAKNRFEFHNVAPGDYILTLGPYLREAVYVESITLDGKPVVGRSFSIPQAQPATLGIVLSGDLANATGHVSPQLRKDKRWEVAWARPKGSVAGRVLGDSQGAYTVHLRSARYNSNASGEYTTHAAPDGAFRFDVVDPGVYTLRAERDSLTYEYGAHDAGEKGTPIVVARGANLKDLKLPGPPQLGAICGRVADVTGAPKPGLRVFVGRFQNSKFEDTTRLNASLQHESETLQTDSSGGFRVNNIPPGEYFFMLPVGDHVVFFSADGSLNAVVPIRVAAGENVGCGTKTPVELHVPSGTDQRHTISGRIPGDLPKSIGDRFWVSLKWDVNTSAPQAYVGYARINSEHKFWIEHVPKGRFVLELYSAYGPEPMTWSGLYGPVSHLLATQKIEVNDQDIFDLKITPMRLPVVTGMVHFEHIPAEWKGFDVSAQSVTLVPHTFRAPFSTKLSADGSFSIDPEDIGVYEVQVGPPSQGPLYISSIRLDGDEIKGRYIHLLADQFTHLDIFVKDDSGQVSVSVVNDPSLPLPEPSVIEPCGNRMWPGYRLVLLPDPLSFTDIDSAVLVQSSLIFGYTAYTAEHLQASGVPPGRYRALVVQQLTKLPPYGIAGQLKPDQRQLWSAIAALGQSVTVEAGAKLSITLPDRTVDVDRLAAQFGEPLEEDVLTAP
jgi:Carboxypeptidase regulatory-like domain